MGNAAAFLQADILSFCEDMFSGFVADRMSLQYLAIIVDDHDIGSVLVYADLLAAMLPVDAVQCAIVADKAIA